MTGREAMALVEREAEEAGVQMAVPEVREVLIAQLEADPATIPAFLRGSRAIIEERRTNGPSPM